MVNAESLDRLCQKEMFTIWYILEKSEEARRD